MQYRLQMYLNDALLDVEEFFTSGYGTNNKINLDLTASELKTAMKNKHADAIKRAGREPVLHLCNVLYSINTFRCINDQ